MGSSSAETYGHPSPLHPAVSALQWAFPRVLPMKVPILIVAAPGTNRDREAAWACELAGGAPALHTLGEVIERPQILSDAKMLVFPGGFSFGDDLGAGKLWATLMRASLGDALRAFDEAGRPILGICNGFQALVRAGILPGPLRPEDPWGAVRATLAHNDSGRFECRPVRLRANPLSPCVFTRELDEDIVCPVAHGEGRLVPGGEDVAEAIGALQLGALRYVSMDGDSPAGYPANPNGSFDDIAGLTNARGNVLGLMPHPEDHILARQHPLAQRGATGGLGLPLFRSGVRYAAES